MGLPMTRLLRRESDYQSCGRDSLHSNSLLGQYPVSDLRPCWEEGSRSRVLDGRRYSTRIGVRRFK